MFNPSLRARAIIGGTVWIAFALSFSGLVLLIVFDDILERRFERQIEDRLDQIAAQIDVAGGAALAHSAILSDPRYDSVGSGLYWQVETPDGEISRSPSLGDVVFHASPQTIGSRTFTTTGPRGEPIRAHARAARDAWGRLWVIYSGESISALNADKSDFRRSAIGALIALGASLVLAGVAQAGLVVSPLNVLHNAFRAYRSGLDERVRGAYPSDIEPLVADLNDLLERNERIISRARRQVADLAHTLKTPAAIMRNEIGRGDGADLEVLRDALDRIETQMARHMARARLAGADAPRAVCRPAQVIDGLVRLFERVGAERGIAIASTVPAELRVRAQYEDIEELFGNLLENAVKWTKSRVTVEGAVVGDAAVISVMDDGPGIPADDREGVLRAGVRLDEAKPGSGLGLAIASDIVDVYGGELELGDAPGGGLKVSCRLPLARD